jgi:hypothetical protein
MNAAAALRQHWPEYLIEGWALGVFMIVAGAVAMLLEWQAMPLHHVLSVPLPQRIFFGIAMGLAAVALIHSPWGTTHWRNSLAAAWACCFWSGYTDPHLPLPP